jgi:hypothetical protein
MKQHILCGLLSIICLSSCRQEADACKADCCKQTIKSKAPEKMTTDPIDGELTCKLTSPELQNRKATVIENLKTKVKEKKETGNGFLFRFTGDDETLALLTDFIRSERQCCDFFSFKLDIRDNETIWMEISGPAGAKEFVSTEMGL